MFDFPHPPIGHRTSGRASIHPNIPFTLLDKAGQVKTASGSAPLVSKVDNGKAGQKNTSKNNGLVPFSGTSFIAKPRNLKRLRGFAFGCGL